MSERDEIRLQESDGHLWAVALPDFAIGVVGRRAMHREMLAVIVLHRAAVIADVLLDLGLLERALRQEQTSRLRLATRLRGLSALSVGRDSVDLFQISDDVIHLRFEIDPREVVNVALVFVAAPLVGGRAFELTAQV